MEIEGRTTVELNLGVNPKLNPIRRALWKRFKIDCMEKGVSVSAKFFDDWLPKYFKGEIK